MGICLPSFRLHLLPRDIDPYEPYDPFDGAMTMKWFGFIIPKDDEPSRCDP